MAYNYPPPIYRMLLVISLVLGVVLIFVAIKPAPVDASPSIQPAATAVSNLKVRAGGAGRTAVSLSPVFAPPVQQWADEIVAWADAFGLDPNLVAIIMQVESCGDPTAVSPAGARGLFQVMPFHFTAGEEMFDPDTNARRGLAYFRDRLAQTSGEIGHAFAGYNGGHVASAGNWDIWPAETRAYYQWTTGLYADIQAGLVESPTLRAWLAAGGSSLCQKAAAQLGL